MKKTFSIPFLILLMQIFLSGLLTPHPAIGEERWRQIGKSRTDTRWYIDEETIFSPEKDIFSVWLRSVPDGAAPSSRDGEESTDDILKDIQRRNFGEYKYTEALWEVDCAKTAFRILYFIAYDRKGETATSSLTPDAPWAPIIPGSVGETLQEALCGE